MQITLTPSPWPSPIKGEGKEILSPLGERVRVRGQRFHPLWCRMINSEGALRAGCLSEGEQIVGCLSEEALIAECLSEGVLRVGCLSEGA